MKEKVKVLLEDGSYVTLEKWQEMYHLTGDQIGKYFSLKESRFQQDLVMYGALIVCAPLMKLLDASREADGESWSLNSFNRDENHQKELKKLGFRAATYSPHVVKMAADKDTRSFKQSREEAKLVIDIAGKKGIICRVGVEDYIKEKQTFIHIDVCPMYFAKGMPFHDQPHPTPWETPYLTW